MSNLPKKILVVDDDPANLTLINGILNSLYKVYLVDSAADALEFLEMQRPNLILMDVEMPGMGGKELFQIVRSKEENSHIPIIFLTGNTSMENEAEAFRLGVDDYIRKPVNDVIMLARVKKMIELEAYRNGS